MESIKQEEEDEIWCLLYKTGVKNRIIVETKVLHVV